MLSHNHNQYFPDMVSPPGETLRETLEALGMSQSELAERMGRPKKTINEIIKGKAALTPDTALQLERVLGISSGFWNNREYHYREFLAMRMEGERLRHKVAWLDEMPVRDMVKLGWILPHADKVKQLQEVLNFFGVASPDVWKRLWCGPKVAFRRSKAFQNDPGLVAGWLRVGEIQARSLDCAPYDADRFSRSMERIRSMTIKPHAHYCRDLIEICAKSGVALVFLPEPPRLSISGATRWLTPQKALMQLSLRYTTDDQFWLTFFHEAGHILYHGKRDVFLETNGRRSKEEAADNFAVQHLLPKDGLDRFMAGGDPTRESLKAYAEKIALAPGVLVGLLQHRGLIPDSQFNDLKKLFKLKHP
ncbi:MAG: plasmid maintenance system antidote protein [Fibrobacteres bacterium]|nr:plasmid maintenance system antidote protein [Fibrobacterota bacterium]